MGKVNIHPPVKFFAALTFTGQAPVEEIEQQLQQMTSAIDHRSVVFPFDRFTSYYESEMGSPLQKQIITFADLRPVEALPDIKISTNLLEDRYRKDGGRQMNIDPGYLTAAKMVLATTKDYDHRLYLGRGIFGDIHLRFRQGHFRLMDWTYPDYQQPEILTFFEQIRQYYLVQLQQRERIE